MGKSTAPVEEVDQATTFGDWVATVGQVPATVPMWLSRRKWISTVCLWAKGEEGQSALRKHHVTVAMFSAVVRAIAHHAEGKTGRNVAVTNETIAAGAAAIHGKCSVRSVKTIRQHILAPAGWAMEVTRGAGQGGGRYNRPSIWHLLSRAVCTLSSSSPVETKSPVATNSPSAARTRRRTPAKKSPATATPDDQDTARTGHTRTLAGHLAGRCLGLGKIHPGRLADVLEASQLELDAWTPRQLLDALNAQMSKSHFSWPAQLTNPAAFLAHRLRALPSRPQVHAATPIPARFIREARSTTASPQTRAAGLAHIRASVINARRAAAA